MNLTIRIAVFAFVTFAAHLSGLSWATFVLGGFWALVAFAYPRCLTYHR